MVSSPATSLIAAQALAARLGWAAEKAEPLLMRLDPQSRTTVLMALVGLVLVGVGLVALVILAGRQVLRLARTSHGPTRRREDDWFRKPLVPREPESPAGRDPE